MMVLQVLSFGSGEGQPTFPGVAVLRLQHPGSLPSLMQTKALSDSCVHALR